MNLNTSDNKWEAHLDSDLAQVKRDPRHIEFDQKAKALGVPYAVIYDYRVAKFNAIFRGRFNRTLDAEEISSSSKIIAEIEEEYPDLKAIYDQTIGPDWQSIET